MSNEYSSIRLKQQQERVTDTLETNIRGYISLHSLAKADHIKQISSLSKSLATKEGYISSTENHLQQLPKALFTLQNVIQLLENTISTIAKTSSQIQSDLDTV
mmetsp:Transcript_4605/g.8346  ORF Transcript_4605/g.8346 Transcript_4605/m.8346 type:complete len:103 (+) Transcript_4605:115-423(+)